MADNLSTAFQAIAGIALGFGQESARLRQEHTANQLALLRLLKDEDHDIQEVPPQEAAQAKPSLMHALMGMGGGNPNTFRVGGHAFRIVPKAGATFGSVFGGGQPQPEPPVGTTSAPSVSYPTEQPLFQTPTAPETPDIPTAPASPVPTPATTGETAATPPPRGTAFASVPSDRRTKILSAVQKASAQSGGRVSPAQLLALIDVESSFDPAAVSPDGAQGLGQLMPATAQRHGVRNAFDIDDNIQGTAKEWQRALNATGGDAKRAYLEVYNPNDPARFEAAAKLQRLIGQYEGLPALAPKLRQRGTPAPPTATSTPEDDAAYRSSLPGPQSQAPPAAASQLVADASGQTTPTPTPADQQPSPLPAAPSIPDVSQGVADASGQTTPAAPGTPTSAPQAFPAEKTPEQFADEQMAPIGRQLGNRNLHFGQLTSLTSMREKFIADYRQAISNAQSRAKDLEKDEPREHVRQALRRVKTPEQLQAVEQWIQTQPVHNYIKEGNEWLALVKKQNNGTIPDSAALEFQQVLLSAKVPETTVKSLLADAGYEEPKERRQATREEQRFQKQQEANIAGEGRRAEQQVKTAGALEQQKEATKGAAFQRAHDAMSGTLSPEQLGGLDPYEYSVKQMNAIGLGDVKQWPTQLQEEHELRQPIKTVAEKTRVDPNTYQVVAVQTKKEAQDKGLIQIPSDAAKQVEEINGSMALLNNLEKDLVKLYGPGGTFAYLHATPGGWDALKRVRGAFDAAVNAKTQLDTSLAPVSALLDNLAPRIGRGEFGERGRTIVSLVNQARGELPRITGSLIPPVLPDKREQAYETFGRVVNILDQLRHALVPGSPLPVEDTAVRRRMEAAEAPAAPRPGGTTQSTGDPDLDAYLKSIGVHK